MNKESKLAEAQVMFDFLDDDSPKVLARTKNLNKENKKQASSALIQKTVIQKDTNPFSNLLNVNSPKTPQNMRQRDLYCNSAEIMKSTPSSKKCISNSPLLKLAMISSHGKRQSLSTGKQVRDTPGTPQNAINFAF